jgi:hypothetical protein
MALQMVSSLAVCALHEIKHLLATHNRGPIQLSG